MKYPVIICGGSSFDMGFRHGRSCASRIRAFYEYSMARMCSGMKFEPREILKRASAYIPFLEKYCPWLLEELRGLAGGAGHTLAEILFLHVRTELDYNPACGCSAFAVSPERTAGKTLLAGQNWDNIPLFADRMIMLNLKPLNKPEILQVTFPGVIGYIGINSAGISVWDNQLMCPGWGKGTAALFYKKNDS